MILLMVKVHIDRLHLDGSKEKIFLGIFDLKEALVLADEDINENWQRYKERYLKEAGYDW